MGRERQTDRQTDRQKDTQTDKQTYRQTEIKTEGDRLRQRQALKERGTGRKDRLNLYFSGLVAIMLHRICLLYCPIMVRIERFQNKIRRTYF